MSEPFRIFTSPPLSIGKAHILNVAFTLTYVVPLYLTKYTMPAYSSKGPNWRWRDDPKVIRARMVSVTLSTVAVCGYVYSLFTSNEVVRSVRKTYSDVSRDCTDSRTDGCCVGFGIRMELDLSSVGICLASQPAVALSCYPGSIPWSSIRSISFQGAALYGTLDLPRAYCGHVLSLEGV